MTDAWLKELAAVKNLITLTIVSMQMTDVGLKELAALKNLTSLSLHLTKGTDAGVEELQKALPKCQIDK